MEGNGPLAGTAWRLDRIILSEDPVADATCARLMDLLPELIPHIAEATKFLGNMSSDRLAQAAVQVVSSAAPFQTVQEFEHLRAKAGPSSLAGSAPVFTSARHPRGISRRTWAPHLRFGDIRPSGCDLLLSGLGR